MSEMKLRYLVEYDLMNSMFLYINRGGLVILDQPKSTSIVLDAFMHSRHLVNHSQVRLTWRWSRIVAVSVFLLEQMNMVSSTNSKICALT